MLKIDSRVSYDKKVRLKSKVDVIAYYRAYEHTIISANSANFNMLLKIHGLYIF